MITPSDPACAALHCMPLRGLLDGLILAKTAAAPISLLPTPSIPANPISSAAFCSLPLSFFRSFRPRPRPKFP
jgi:hypothetical protein